MREHFLELIRRTSTSLPHDVKLALAAARRKEPPDSPGRAALGDVLANCELARETSRPLCQDTGTNIWYIFYPRKYTQAEISREIVAATRMATRRAFLRSNAVDSVTGVNSGDNTGLGAPVIHLHEWTRKALVADLMLKGGGSENVSTMYKLPHGLTRAARDLEGVRRVVIDAVFQAQGMGCAPGIIGVGIGGDRATGMMEAKEQLFRLIDDKNKDPLLGKLERRLTKECNQLGIGPMGFGGATTVLGVKIGKLHRLPASFFVSVAYMCWAARRSSMTLTSKGARYEEICELAKRHELPARVLGKRRS